MSAGVAKEKSISSEIAKKERKISLEHFRQKPPKDGWKYDWNNGIITRYKQMVSEKQRYIVRNVLRAFHKTNAYQQGHDLISESEMAYDNSRYRVPDMAYYTKAQTYAAAEGQHAVASFVIEILSDTDLAKNIENKLWEYFEEGVQVVWHIVPYRQIVKVYTSPFQVKICQKEEICSAAPAISDFEMMVQEIFELKN